MRFSTAMGISVAFHAALAAGLCLYLAHAPTGVVVAELDLSSVELSFAEEELESAAAVQAPPPAPEMPPPPVNAPRPPEFAPPDDPLPAPPDPEALKLPEPASEPPPPLDLPEPKPQEEPKTQAEPEPNAEPPPEAESEPPAAPPAPAVPAAAPRQAHVDAPPSLKKTIRPDYPRGARTRGEEGDVQLEIAVDAQGTVTGVTVVSACPFAELNEAAVKAARKARFTPARQGRQAVACTARITLTFRLKD